MKYEVHHFFQTRYLHLHIQHQLRQLQQHIKLKKPRGILGGTSTYNLYRNNTLVANDKNKTCSVLVHNLNNNTGCFLSALSTLITDFNILTDNGLNYKKFKHFNELFVSMINHYLTNLLQYTNQSLLEPIQKIMQTNWCDITNETTHCSNKHTLMLSLSSPIIK